jgi:ABC-2 type transport system permease protein
VAGAAQGQAHAGAALRRDRHADHVHGDVHLPVRWRARRSPDAYPVPLPGILVQTVAFTTIYTGFTLNSDISKGIFDRFRSIPIWRPSPVVGAMAGDTVRYTISSDRHRDRLHPRLSAGGATGVLASLVLLNVFGFGMSWIFVVLAMIVRTPLGGDDDELAVLMPLTFASNILRRPGDDAGWLQQFIHVNPVAILVTAVRDLMAGTRRSAPSACRCLVLRSSR